MYIYYNRSYRCVCPFSHPSSIYFSLFSLQNGLTALHVASAKRGSRMYRLFHQSRSRGYNAICQLLQRCSQKSTGPPPTHQDKPAANVTCSTHQDTSSEDQDENTENDLMQTLLPIPQVSWVCPAHTHTHIQKHNIHVHLYVVLCLLLLWVY